MTTSHLPQRRSLLVGLAALPLATLVHSKTTTIPLEVWKDPQCGCCKDWVKHLEAHGFSVTVYETGNAAMRAQLGIPTSLGSCHTARVGGFAIEGHVPAADIHRLLKEKPPAIGLTVPGMPIGSPGMDGAVYGARRDAYNVLLILRQDGGTRVFASYPKA